MRDKNYFPLDNIHEVKEEDLNEKSHLCEPSVLKKVLLAKIRAKKFIQKVNFELLGWYSVKKLVGKFFMVEDLSKISGWGWFLLRKNISPTLRSCFDPPP